MNKKLLSILLALVMLLSVAAIPVMAEEAKEEAQPEDMTDADTLVIGAPQLSGSYINGFGNDVYDIYVKSLIGNYGDNNSYTTVYADQAGQFKFNPTVNSADPSSEENEDGSKTYTFYLANDLVWNDGTPITAKDYVFGTLLNASPQWLAQGAQNASGGEPLLGFEEYQGGETPDFLGIEYVDDYTFKVTIKGEKLPYFYDLSWAGAAPSPLHRLAPNLDIEGSEVVVKEGYEPTDEDKQQILDNLQAKIDKAQEKHDAEQAWWDAEQADYPDKYSEEDIKSQESYIQELQDAVDEIQAEYDAIESGEVEMDAKELLMTEATLDLAYNYRFNPDVTAGPYNFVEFGNNMAKLTINEKYKGNSEGQLPTIKNVIVQTVNTALEVDYVINGILDISPDNMEAKKINKAKENADKVNILEYARNGYGQLRIRNDFSPTQYKGVRQAIAYSLDRDQFVSDVAGGYGIVVDGAFGIAQFEYVDVGEELENHEDYTHYTLNTDMANAALDNDSPYLYEKDGKTPWDAEKAQQLYDEDKENFDYWRYDENGNECRIVEYGTEGVEVTTLIQVMLPDNCKRVGINFIVKAVDWATLSSEIDKPTPKTEEAGKNQASAFNMGVGFSIPNDPYYQWHSSQIGVGDNKNYVNDPDIDELTENMRKRDPSDVEGWEEDWIKFQLWFNDNMPEIPLYANQYFTITSKRLQGVEVTPMWNWYNSICNMTIVEE